nr:hypothetical protein [Tanacetum cinerariifolium]
MPPGSIFTPNFQPPPDSMFNLDFKLFDGEMKKKDLDEEHFHTYKQEKDVSNSSHVIYLSVSRGSIHSAFNVLRETFNDTNLSMDISGFSAEIDIIAIIQKRESGRRALT